MRGSREQKRIAKTHEYLFPPFLQGFSQRMECLPVDQSREELSLVCDELIVHLAEAFQLNGESHVARADHVLHLKHDKYASTFYWNNFQTLGNVFHRKNSVIISLVSLLRIVIANTDWNSSHKISDICDGKRLIVSKFRKIVPSALISK